jgi:hypothetical protein
MKIFTLIFETSENGIYTESFKTKVKALNFLKDWDSEIDMLDIIKEIKQDGYYFCDDKRPWGIILEENELK